jgi:hypothetical protein
MDLFPWFVLCIKKIRHTKKLVHSNKTVSIFISGSAEGIISTSNIRHGAKKKVWAGNGDLTK